MNIWESLSDQDPESIAAAINGLAGLLQLGGDLDQAQELHERALVILETSKEVDGAGIAIKLSRLAQLSQAKGDLHKAESLYMRAIAASEEANGTWKSSTHRIKSKYAELLLQTYRPEEAVSIANTALAIHEHYKGRNHM